MFLNKTFDSFLKYLNAIVVAFLTALPAQAVIISQTDVFVGGGEGPEGSAVFRIPGMVVAPDGSILAFAESRMNGQDPGYPGASIAMVTKRSTDGGVTWSPLTVLHTSSSFDYSDPRAVVDSNSGDVKLLYAQWPDGCGTACVPAGLGNDSSQMFLRSSSDNGQTWSAPNNITSQVKDSDWEALNNAGPGAGIALRWQSVPARNGRLVTPVWRRNTSNATNNLSMYSDDGGTTWESGSGAVGVSSEATTVELINGQILMDVRTGGVRLRTISSDGGQTWGPTFNSDIAMSAVHAAMLRYSAQRDGDERDRILMSGPLGNPVGAGNGRSNIGIWTSYDEGKTFINPVQIDSGYGGYSVLQKLHDNSIGLLFEVDNAVTIQHINFDLAELEGMQHQQSLTHYDGFNNSIDRKRGGVGWSGSWEGSGRFTDTNETAFDGKSSIPFDGFRFDVSDGRVDLATGSPREVVRKLTGNVHMDHSSTSYFSMIISQSLDTSADDATDEFFRFELRDTKGVAQISFGAESDESFFVNAMGDSVTTPADSLQRNKSYFLVSKVVTQSDSVAGNYDQVFMKVFESGVDAIPDTDELLNWTLVSAANKNSSSVIDTIALVGGTSAVWSADELRIGTSFGSVASNLADGALFNGLEGDVNQDGVVSGDGSGPADTDDLTAFLEGWQSRSLGLPLLERVKLGDLDLNGTVDLSDVRVLRDALLAQGQTIPIEVPEPSGKLLLGYSAYFILVANANRPCYTICSLIRLGD